MTKTVKRLFEQFQPEHYDLQLKLYPDTMTFWGSVIIHGKKVGRPSKRITLHQKGLKIEEAFIRRTDKKGEKIYEVERVNTQGSFDEVRIHASEMLYPGEYNVMVNFSGKITDGMTGIYPCYFTHDGKEKKLIATQFESHHAREAFPCIDEPEAKATYSLVLNTPDDGMALSNTPAIDHKTDADSHRQITEFDKTPRMSSYLLAFVYGEMQTIGTKTKSGVDVSIWATFAQPKESLDFALDVAKRSIEFFEDYFNVAYPLPKADHIALPDFSSGAMENWGLITYRERVLLAYLDETSQSLKEQIATVIAHETSHQWFGNLVTMKWWDDLWLNESFANMMEYQAVAALFPDWNIWNSFVGYEGLSALRRDALPGVQSVKVSVHHPDEISTLFDPSIVYAKGGRLLNMLKNYIGEEAFRKGLTDYFNKHKYGNTTGADLWRALSDASGKDIGAFMNPWLERSGFPVITVEQSGKELSISQEHFLDDPSKADRERVWPVPLFAFQAGVPPLLEKRSEKLPIRTDEPALLNKNAVGHYIVNYSDAQHKTFIRESLTAHTIFNDSERLILLNDASMLARAGYQHFGEAVLSLLDAYKTETSEPVWDTISMIIGEARRFVFLDESLEDKIKAQVRQLIQTELERLGWDEKPGESSEDQKLRATIIGLGAYAEEPTVVDKSLELFKQYKDKQLQLSAELRSIIFSVPVKLGKLDAFTFLLDLHDKTQNSDLKGDIAGAVTATRNTTEAGKLLERLKNGKLVKPQDVDRWFVYILRNRYTMDIAWDWLVANWDWLEETFKNDKSYDYLPRYAASAINTPAYAEKYKTFFGPKQDQIALQRNILIGLEEIDVRVAWLERDLPSVQKFYQ